MLSTQKKGKRIGLCIRSASRLQRESILKRVFASFAICLLILHTVETTENGADLKSDVENLRLELKTVEKELHLLQRNFSTELLNLQKRISVDACENHPCENGGKCVNLGAVNHYKCLCKRTFRGHRCQHCAHGFHKVGTYCKFHEKAFSHRLGKFGQSYYVIGKVKLNWDDAKEACQNIGGNLSSMETNEEWDHLFEQLKLEDGKSLHWLGAKGTVKGWNWINGIPLTSSPKGIGAWRRQQPNHFHLGSSKVADEVCLISNWPSYSRSDDNWWDNKCQLKARFVCEFKSRN